MDGCKPLVVGNMSMDAGAANMDLDVGGLVDDIGQSMQDGKIQFAKKWMDKYSSFFEVRRCRLTLSIPR